MITYKMWRAVSLLALLAIVAACGGPSTAPTAVPTAPPTQAAVAPTATPVPTSPPTATPLPTAKPTAKPTAATFTDPFAYCAAVGDLDKPDARYVGQPVPEAIAAAVRTASGAAPDAPLDMFLQGSAWRCMGGKVYGCFVGANIPCWSQANTDRTPTAAATEFCTAQPNAETIPAYVTGHDTVYEWRCNKNTPEIVRQVLQVDARGYVTDFWYELTP